MSEKGKRSHWGEGMDGRMDGRGISDVAQGREAMSVRIPGREKGIERPLSGHVPRGKRVRVPVYCFAPLLPMLRFVTTSVHSTGEMNRGKREPHNHRYGGLRRGGVGMKGRGYVKCSRARFSALSFPFLPSRQKAVMMSYACTQPRLVCLIEMADGGPGGWRWLTAELLTIARCSERRLRSMHSSENLVFLQGLAASGSVVAYTEICSMDVYVCIHYTRPNALWGGMNQQPLSPLFFAVVP